MASEPDPEKKVVKRVVRKPVAKKSVQADDQAVDEPTIRFGRPTTKTAARPPAVKSKAKTGTRPSTKPVKQPKAPRPSNEWGKKTAAAFASGRSRVGSGAKSSFTSTRGAISGGYTRMRALRIPTLEPRVAAAITGLLVSALTLGLFVLFANLFSALRGTSTGGGRWGSITIVVLAFAAFALGEFLLTKFGVLQARLVSIMAVFLAAFAILALFLGVIDTMWALLVLPVVGVVTFVIAQILIDIADKAAHSVE